jgi:DNA-binding transcriptional LysR family regulator
LKELSSHDLIHFGTLTLNREWRRGHKAIRIGPRLRTDGVDASIEAAIHDIGITRRFSCHVKRELKDGKLVKVLPTSERANAM